MSLLPELAGNGPDHTFFLRAAHAQRAGVATAMAGIERDQLGRNGGVGLASDFPGDFFAGSAAAAFRAAPRAKLDRPDKAASTSRR